MARLAKHVYHGKDLKTIKNLKAAIARVRSMDVRNAAYNTEHPNDLQRVMYFNGTLSAKATSLENRCDSACMQTYALPAPN